MVYVQLRLTCSVRLCEERVLYENWNKTIKISRELEPLADELNQSPPNRGTCVRADNLNIRGSLSEHVQGYLSHKKQPPSLGLPQGPGHILTVGS